MLFDARSIVVGSILVWASAAHAAGSVEQRQEEILRELSELRKANGELAQQVAKLREDVDALRAGNAPSDTSFDLKNASYPVLGDAKAAVAIVEFSDFQCPFCLRYFRTTAPEITRKYVDTGKVRYVFVDFPLDFHENAEPAAVAGVCANRQHAFWKMRDRLFEHQTALSRDTFSRVAGELRLDTTAFDKCLGDAGAVSVVRDHAKTGVAFGVSGTPTFLVGRVENGVLVEPTMITGAQPLATFERALDALLPAPKPG